MTTPQALCLLTAWVLFVPAAAAQIAHAIADERIFARGRAYVGARWPGGFLDYLVRCPVCLSQHVSALAAGLFFPLWRGLMDSWPGGVLLGILAALFASRMAIKVWL